MKPPRAPGVRRTPYLLVDRAFGPYFAAKLLWSTALWAYNITAAIVVFDLTRSVLMVGMVSVAQFVPQMILTPWSGARADRGDRRRQVVIGRVISATSSGTLVIWILTAGLDGSAGATAVIVATFVTGIGDAIGLPATLSLVPALVRPGELPSAVALDSAPFPVARATGPAIGAFLAATLGPAYVFGLVSVANAVFIVIMLAIPIRGVTRPGPIDGSVRAGLAYLRSEATLIPLLIGVGVLGFGGDPVITLTPSIADSLGGGSELVGALASAFGVGAGVCFFLLGTVRRRLGLARSATTGLLTIAISMLGLAASGTTAVALSALFLAGVGYTLAVASLATMVQTHVAEELRGRIMALWLVALLGSRPLAAAANGAIADLTSTSAALVFVAVLVVLGTWAARPSRTTKTDDGAGSPSS